MQIRLLPPSLVIALTLSFSVSGCSKKSEPTPPPAPPVPTPAVSSADTTQALLEAADAKLAEAKKEAELAKAQTEAAAKAKIAEAKHAADDLSRQAADTANSLLGTANTLKSNASSAPSSSSAAATTAAPVTTSLQTVAHNLTPANFSAWYDKANAESSGIIASLASKATDPGSQTSPQLKSLYETALTQKKTFDDISSQLKTGGLTQWVQLYPKLQTSWGDLSKSLTEAKALLAQFK